MINRYVTRHVAKRYINRFDGDLMYVNPTNTPDLLVVYLCNSRGVAIAKVD